MQKIEIYEYSEQEVLTYLRNLNPKKFSKLRDEIVLDHATDYDFSPVHRRGDTEEYFWSQNDIQYKDNT